MAVKDRLATTVQTTVESRLPHGVDGLRTLHSTTV
jgi:hypothetical protein